MSKHGGRKREEPSSVPFSAIIAGVVAVIAICGAVIVALSLGKGLDSHATPLVVSLLGIVATAVPSMLAAVKSDRVSRDVRNGVVVEASRKGATKAIQEQQVMTRVGPAVTAELAALTELVLTNRQIAGHLEGILPPSRPVLTNPPPPGGEQ